MGKVVFTLNGKEACLGGPGPQAKKFIDFVTHIPEGKYFDAYGICECLKLNMGALHPIIRRSIEEIDGYYLSVPGPRGTSHKRIFGSKKSIESLKKKLQEQDII